MPKIIPLALTYDDVLLVPQRSRVEHRADVDTSTYLTSKIKLNIPFISANMDTVTKGNMAIAMARAGGIGIIHRFLSIENQVKEVDKVKRLESAVIENPYTISPKKTVQKVTEIISKNGVSSFMVVDDHSRLVGIITRRDIIFAKKSTQKISEVMTPLNKLITATANISHDKAKKILSKHKVEKLPLVDENGYLVGLMTARSLTNSEQNPMASKNEKGQLLCGAAVGVVGDYLERARALLQAGTDVLVVDVAHGQNKASLKALKNLRKNFPTAQIIGGNIATFEGAKDLIKAGVDAVKVGIGPGGICSTRLVAGVGVPQLTAIMDCVRAVKNTKVKVIADGGTNYPGDISKALAAGASTIMLAGWFAGTEESPGEIIVRKNKRFKVHRGSASFMSQSDRLASSGKEVSLNTIVPEGVESLMEFKGPVSDIIHQLAGALRSGMSYCNAMNIEELQKNARFIRMTQAGFRESLTHNISEI